MSDYPERLRGLSEIRHYLFSQDQPIWYLDCTNFHLIGMDEWVQAFRSVNYSDCFAGAHPSVFVPSQDESHTYPFATLAECNNHLLRHPQVREHLGRFPPGKVFFMMFDETTVTLAEELGLEVILPSLALRKQVDSKVDGTRIGDRAGVASVPNALGHVGSYEELRRLGAHLGETLVVQTPFGDSGETTYFIRTPEDFAQHAADITAQAEVKVMKKISCRSTAIEACVTAAGTIVGPLLTELVGFPELTTHGGGWSGNEACPEAFTPEIRTQAAEGTARIGDELARLGYRGYFELDYLIDRDTGALYLGEINPRLTGCSALTNLAAFAHADAPLFLFHLLEYSGKPFELDVAEINRRWASPVFLDSWSQMIIRHVEPRSLSLTSVAKSGVWRLRQDGRADYLRMQTHRRIVSGDDQAFFLSIPTVGDQVDTDDDYGILVLRGRLMDSADHLTERAQRWIQAIHAEFAGTPI